MNQILAGWIEYDIKMDGGTGMIVELDRLAPGEWGKVVGIETDQTMQKRLRDFGLVLATNVGIDYRSPRGDVAAVKLRGSVLALRSKDLRKIQVEV